MKRHLQTRISVPMVLILLLPVGLGSCKKRRSYTAPRPTPVFFEAESNDTELDANDFGVLAPGDHFIIEGHIDDSGFDPFDGFAFRSREPISIDFDLFIDRPGADLDLCLFDVATADEFCFQTADNPEYGTIDVFAGGVDFHLVVESYVGSSTYGLELRVYRLATGEAAEAALADASGAIAPASENLRLRSSSRPDGSRSAAPSLQSYARQRDERGPERVLGHLLKIEVDLETGEVERAEAILVD